MSKHKPTESISTSSRAEPVAPDLSDEQLQSRRVDTAHAAANHDSEAAPAAASSQPAANEQALEEEAMLIELAASEPDYTPEQLRHQTLQLAALLSERQRQLDRRETELNAQTAKLEKELRSAQMWSREKQYELQQREAKQQQRAEEIKEQRAGVFSAQGSWQRDLQARQTEIEQEAARLKQRTGELSTRENNFRRRQHEFELAREVRQSQWLEQQRELAAERQRVEHRRQQAARMFADMSRQLERRREAIEQHWQHCEANLATRSAAGSAEVEQALDDLAARKEALNEHATGLDDQQADLQQQREQLTETRQQHELDMAHRQQAFTEEKEQWQATRRESEAQWKRRRESLDQRAKSLQALHEEVTAHNRESLELRLGVEQIWNQLAGKAAPAELTRRLGQFRSKLAEQQREDRLVLQRRREEIMRLATDLQQKQASMRQRQQELQHWVARRNEDLEEQAARLVAREQELDRQQQCFLEGKQAWGIQRTELQQQIRRLQSQLRQSSHESIVVGS